MLYKVRSTITPSPKLPCFTTKNNHTNHKCITYGPVTSNMTFSSSLIKPPCVE